jgi:peptidoglycan/LPS O-acetylase OafA/YrhL
MYYLALVFFTVLDGLSKRYFAPYGLQWWYPLLTLGFLNGWHPETINSVVPGGWSIVVEMTFYLLVPFLFVRLKDMKSTILFIVIALAVGWLLNQQANRIFSPIYPDKLHYMVDSFTFFWFFSQLPIFGIGILVFHLFEKYKNIRDRQLGFVLLAAAVFLEWAFLSTSTYKELIPHHFMMAVGFGFLVFGLYFSNTRILVNPVTVWIGKLSFSIYLVHFAVLRLVDVVFPGGFPVKGNLGMFLGYLLIAEVSILISVLTYRYVEKPGISLGKSLIEKLEAAHGFSAEPTREG